MLCNMLRGTLEESADAAVRETSRVPHNIPINRHRIPNTGCTGAVMTL